MRIIVRIHRVLLHVYPADFRREFGPEMDEVFAMQLGAAVGPWEAALVRWYVFKEVFTLALPMRALDPKFVAPAVSLLGTPAVLLPLLWALNNPRTLNLLTRNVFGPYR
jgi:hypothetical protein